jgi:glycosyltransferase involved in cell wall biosynthesis
MATPIPRRFLDCPPVPRARRQLERVLFAGRLAPEKNLDAIVAAARRLPDIEFLIVGDGPLAGVGRGAVPRLPNLSHTGWVSRSRIMT